MVSGYRGTLQHAIRPPRDSTGLFVRDVISIELNGIVCTGPGHCGAPRDGIQPPRDSTGMFVRHPAIAVLHGIFLYRVQPPWYSTELLCAGRGYNRISRRCVLRPRRTIVPRLVTDGIRPPRVLHVCYTKRKYASNTKNIILNSNRSLSLPVRYIELIAACTRHSPQDTINATPSLDEKNKRFAYPSLSYTINSKSTSSLHH